jgi:hypothetical protein
VVFAHGVAWLMCDLPSPLFIVDMERQKKGLKVSFVAQSAEIENKYLENLAQVGFSLVKREKRGEITTFILKMC